MSRQGTDRRRARAGLLVAIASFACSGAAWGGDDGDFTLRDDWQQLIDNQYYRLQANVRARLEVANVGALRTSEAWTLRGRVGLGSKPRYGVSTYVELEGVAAFNQDQYFDVVNPPNTNMRSPIADPEVIQLNRATVQYEGLEKFQVKALVGRQRIILDDARFVGNVGWRQDEQTFDSVYGQSSLGLDGLMARYGYLWSIKRIFGNQGPPGGPTKDFESNSHLVNASYAAEGPWPSVAAFAYLLDFENSAANSSDSFGFRATGAIPFGEEWKLVYAGSYAYQMDAANNPTDYDASYGSIDAMLRYAKLGGLGVGFELLGSDDGVAQFRTPLATAHKFNGFADVFLDNGGPGGLRDLSVALAPALPYGIEGKFIFHQFWNDVAGDELGSEFDYVFSKKITKNWSILTKGAWFWGKPIGPPDTYRIWFDLTFEF